VGFKKLICFNLNYETTPDPLLIHTISLAHSEFLTFLTSLIKHLHNSNEIFVPLSIQIMESTVVSITSSMMLRKRDKIFRQSFKKIGSKGQFNLAHL